MVRIARFRVSVRVKIQSYELSASEGSLRTSTHGIMYLS